MVKKPIMKVTKSVKRGLTRPTLTTGHCATTKSDKSVHRKIPRTTRGPVACLLTQKPEQCLRKSVGMSFLWRNKWLWLWPSTGIQKMSNHNRKLRKSTASLVQLCKEELEQRTLLPMELKKSMIINDKDYHQKRRMHW